MTERRYCHEKTPLQSNYKYLIPLLLVLCLAGQASACSLFYSGGDFTDDGANLFFRGEDQDGADENKLYLVTPAGTNKAGDHYQGCFGFTWVFTHDNYRYLSRRDDNLEKAVRTAEERMITAPSRKPVPMSAA